MNAEEMNEQWRWKVKCYKLDDWFNIYLLFFSEVSRTGKYQDQYMHCYKDCTLENVQL